MWRSGVLTRWTETQHYQDEEGNPGWTDRSAESWTGAGDKEQDNPGECEPEPDPGQAAEGVFVSVWHRRVELNSQ